MRGLRLAIVALVTATLLSEVGYRVLLQSEFIAAAGERDPAAQNIAASLPFPLTPGLVLHHAVGVTISMHRVNLGALTSERVTARATGVQLKILPSLTRRRVDVTSVQRVDFSAEISQTEASRTLPSGYSYEFQSATVILKGPGSSALTGRFQVRGPAEVIFILPGLQTSPVIRFSGFPFSGCVQGVTVVPGRAIITCSKVDPGSDFTVHP